MGAGLLLFNGFSIWTVSSQLFKPRSLCTKKKKKHLLAGVLFFDRNSAAPHAFNIYLSSYECSSWYTYMRHACAYHCPGLWGLVCVPLSRTVRSRLRGCYSLDVCREYGLYGLHGLHGLRAAGTKGRGRKKGGEMQMRIPKNVWIG